MPSPMFSIMAAPTWAHVASSVYFSPMAPFLNTVKASFTAFSIAVFSFVPISPQSALCTEVMIEEITVPMPSSTTGILLISAAAMFVSRSSTAGMTFGAFFLMLLARVRTMVWDTLAIFGIFAEMASTAVVITLLRPSMIPGSPDLIPTDRLVRKLPMFFVSVGSCFSMSAPNFRILIPARVMPLTKVLPMSLLLSRAAAPSARRPMASRAVGPETSVKVLARVGRMAIRPPMPAIAGPTAAASAPIFSAPSCVDLSAFRNASTYFVASCTTFRKPFSASPHRVISRPSRALLNRVISPLALSSMTRFISEAEPVALSIDPHSFSKSSSVAFMMARRPGRPRAPAS